MNEPRAAFVPALPQADPKEAGLSPAGLDRVTAIMQHEVDSHRIPGVSMLIARGGKIAYRRDIGALRPGGSAMPNNAVFRIYSMTKPIVSVALMMLVEDGRLFINDPVAKFLPAFAEPKVGVERNGKLELVPAERAITVQDLLRHTSGLTYAFTGDSAVQQLYRKARLFTGDPANADRFLERDISNDEFYAGLAKLPLIAQPGAAWNYGHSTDVLGRIVELVSGRTLGSFLHERILAPLGMHETAFFATAEQQQRLAEPFAKDPDRGEPVQLINVDTSPRFESGGGGLVSTMDDYTRFLLMLYHGGTFGGVRILGRKTLAFMTSDHLGPHVRIPPSTLLPPGHRFGLGFAVRCEPGMAPTAGAPGEYFWGGVAGTVFWIAPNEELIALMMTQGPRQRDYYRQLFRNLVYATLA